MIIALSSGASPMTEDKISFTGSKLFARSGRDWEAALKGSGTLRFSKSPGLVDVWILDAGVKGGSGSGDAYTYIYSGKGGNGGRHKLFTVRLEAGVDYAVTIGQTVGYDSSGNELSGAETSLIGGSLSLSASSGQRSAGGSRAAMPQNNGGAGTVNTGGADGVYPYDEASQTSILSEISALGKLAAGGGAGDANNNRNVYTDQHGGVNDGGQDGGGDGATRSNYAGSAGTGYGSGGGGGYGLGQDPGSSGPGGDGAPGLVLMRPHKEAAA